MQTIFISAAAVFFLASMSACQPAAEPGGEPAGSPSTEAAPAASPRPIASSTVATARFAAIAADETIRLVGTEPFWGGTVEGGEFVYTTVENQAGETIAVRRFAGNNGLGFSGVRQGKTVDLTITPGTCSDGMSDRSFPFTATLKLGEEQRNGCAWTDRTPFTGAENP